MIRQQFTPGSPAAGTGAGLPPDWQGAISCHAYAWSKRVTRFEQNLAVAGFIGCVPVVTWIIQRRHGQMHDEAAGCGLTRRLGTVRLFITLAMALAVGTLLLWIMKMRADLHP